MNRPTRKKLRTPPALVTIGASLGGMQAIEAVLEGLSDDFSLPIAVAQHRHRTSTRLLPRSLQRFTDRSVCDAEHETPIEPRCIYFAPADYHLLVVKGRFLLSVDEPVHYARPSIDLLFESAADAYGAGVIAVILTGANADGATGAALVKKRGGLVIVQDPATAEAPAMPTAALPTANFVLPLNEIGAALSRAAREAD